MCVCLCDEAAQVWISLLVRRNGAKQIGHDEVCSVLLQHNADLNSRNVFEETALDLAASRGHLSCVRVLISHGSNVNGDKFVSTTPLHHAAEKGHDKVVQFLLDKEANIAAINPKGQSALELALDCNEREVARVLLMDKNWEMLMKRSKEMPNGRHKEERITPMRQLLAKFPEIASLAMDRCISHGNTGPLAVVNYNFEYIDDTFMMPAGQGQILKACDDEGLYPFNEDGHVRKEAEPYNRNMDRIYLEHPLKLMANSERIQLLSHPLVVALLKYKWNHLGRYVYYSASFVYLIFLISLTTFLALIPAPFNVKMPDGNGTLMDVMDHLKTTCDQIDNYYTPLAHFCKTIVVLLAAAQIIKEMYQLWTRRWAYLSVENLLEIFIYVSALITMIDWSPCTEHSAIRLNWQWMLATLGTFIAWINLLLLIRKLPRFGIFVLMFFDVFKTFSKFAIIFILFILAFSVTFFLMMQNRPEFSSIPLSVIKTTVMTIGEMEYNGIFHGALDNHEEGLFTKEIAFPVFFIFCIVMTILLMNLLVGLAVDDIKSVQEKAEIKRLSMQVDLVLQVERSMSFLRRRITRSHYALYPNKMSLWKKFRRLFGSDQLGSLSEIISQHSAEEESSEMRREFAMQREALNHLQSNIDYLYERQVKFEGILEMILQKLDNIENKANEQQRTQVVEEKTQDDEVSQPVEPDQEPNESLQSEEPSQPQPFSIRGRRGRF
ncbi:unnamed protein product, partial [Mesorhabditis belari]|uniref:Ion transport domain-containing protein n=1 Tax=Mesorhabditis belari TaxID=2138241 RepID=A0AAF3F0K3_9BILA